MKITRPQFCCFIAGRYALVNRTPLSTFTSKKRCQSSSAISSNGTGSKIPRLLIRISTSGNCFVSFSVSAAIERSPANPSTLPLAVDLRDSIACLTEASERPLTITFAPSSASALAMEKPMPAVLPLIKAVLLFSCRSIKFPLNRQLTDSS